MKKSELRQIIREEIKSLKESYYNLDQPLSNLHDESIFFGNDEGVVLELYSDGRTWREGRVEEGEEPYGWGSKTYQSYLTLNEVINYLRQDYGGSWRVIEY